MANSSYTQHSFLGGEWGKYAQGRYDKPEYRSAMNFCYNGLPVEQGAWTRRPGTLQASTTRNGVPGVIRSFYFNETEPYLIEFTPGYARFHGAGATVGTAPIAVQSIDGASPATVLLNTSDGWSVGDQMFFNVVNLTSEFGDVANLIGRQFSIIATPTGSSLTIVDSVTGVFDGSTVTLGTNSLTASKIVEVQTGITQDLDQIRIVQNDDAAIVLAPGVAPQVITAAASGTSFALSPATFLDGPYLDPPTDGSYLVPTGTEGTITLVASGPGSINSGRGFLATDVGRSIRLFSEPTAWDDTTSYAAGDTVNYGGSYFTALTAGTNQPPGTSPTAWAVNPSGATWTWGSITTIVNLTTVQVRLSNLTYDIAGNPMASGPLLYELAINLWRLGVYSDTTGWPLGGCYHESRLWLYGAIPNRFDASSTDDIFQFQPTDLYGTVSDNNGISGTVNASETNAIYWMIPDHSGIVMGTRAGEWSISASNMADPLTPSSIQAHRVTKFGSENIEPRRTGMSLCFVRRYGRKLTEYVSDVYSGKYSGTDLSVNSAHLMDSGIAEIGYQMETTPIIWARMKDNTLKSMTYRRDSPFGTQAASFAGWARHELGSGRSVLSIAVGPVQGGNSDAVSLLTQDPATGYCYVETMTPIFLETDPISNAWFVDGAANPTFADVITVDDQQYVRFYGLFYVVGQTVTVFGAGFDLGDYVVASDGTIDVPIGPPNPAAAGFTFAYLQSISDPNGRYQTTVGENTNVTVYNLGAAENFDANWVTKFVTGKHQAAGFFLNQNWGSGSYDRFNNLLIYTFGDYASFEGTTAFSPHNQTAFTQWNGYQHFAPGDLYGSSRVQNFYVATKNLGTGEVFFYNTYDPDTPVPEGVGFTMSPLFAGSDGTTWRYRLPARGLDNTQRIVDPWSGNLWLTVPGGSSVTLLRKAENFKYSRNAFTPNWDGANGVTGAGTDGLDHTREYIPSRVAGISFNWTFIEQLQYSCNTLDGFTGSPPFYPIGSLLVLTPRDYDTAEVNGVLAEYVTPIPYLVGLVGADGEPLIPNGRFIGSTRYTLDSAGNLYVFGYVVNPGIPPETKNWKLYKFTPPTGTYPSLSGGSWTDITPWTSSSGPNTSIDDYYYDFPAENKGSNVAKNYMLRLPQHNQIACITKRLPCDNENCVILTLVGDDVIPSAGTPDSQYLGVDCTYVDINGAIFDYHEGFITGFMDATWSSSSKANAKYAVQDLFEMDTYLDTTSYVFHDQDYSTRWVMALVQPVVGGSWSYDTSKNRLVMIQYRFVYGQDPEVLQVVDEQGWDTGPDALAIIADNFVTNPNLVYNALDVSYGQQTIGGYSPGWDCMSGLYYAPTNTFWFTDTNTENASFIGAHFGYNGYFGPPGGRPQGEDQTIPPFITLSYTNSGSDAPVIPFALGSNYQSQGQIVRPIAPQEAGSQNGPALGKTRRTHQIAALLASTADISFGTTFTVQRPAAFKTPGGTALPTGTLYSGIHWTTIEDDYSFDSMTAWSTYRPWPATLVSLEMFLHTQDR